MNAVSNPVTHPAFEFLRRENLESLGISIEEYRHRETGAIHLHMNADSDENVFMVALRTYPRTPRGWPIFSSIRFCVVAKNTRCAIPFL